MPALLAGIAAMSAAKSSPRPDGHFTAAGSDAQVSVTNSAAVIRVFLLRSRDANCQEESHGRRHAEASRDNRPAFAHRAPGRDGMAEDALSRLRGKDALVRRVDRP